MWVEQHRIKFESHTFLLRADRPLMAHEILEWIKDMQEILKLEQS
jgi:hypothetical protein